MTPPNTKLAEAEKTIENWEEVLSADLKKYCKRNDIGWNVIASGAFVLKVCKRTMKKLLTQQSLISYEKGREDERVRAKEIVRKHMWVIVPNDKRWHRAQEDHNDSLKEIEQKIINSSSDAK